MRIDSRGSHSVVIVTEDFSRFASTAKALILPVDDLRMINSISSSSHASSAQSSQSAAQQSTQKSASGHALPEDTVSLSSQQQNSAAASKSTADVDNGEQH